jgi:putative phosphoribosyl transferase
MVLIKELDLGVRLAAKLRKRQLANPIVIAMSSGGVRLAWELARDLRLPMDVLTTLEIVVPGYRQVRIGAVAGNTFLADQAVLASEGLPADYVERLAARGMRRQEELDRLFRRRQPPLTITKSGVILVDNGWSSLVAVQAAVEALKRRGAAEIIYASPICGDETYERIQGKVSIVALYPRNARQSVLVGNRSLASVTIEEAATWIEASRGFGKRSTLPSLMERRPAFNDVSPVARIVESNSR